MAASNETLVYAAVHMPVLFKDERDGVINKWNQLQVSRTSDPDSLTVRSVNQCNCEKNEFLQKYVSVLVASSILPID